MTISSTTSLNQYTASSGQTVFPYTFKVFAEGDLKVIVADTNGTETTQTLNSDYTVSGVGNANGGNITFTTGVTLNYTVTITRNEPLTQEIDYVEGDDFPADSHEEGLDRSAIRDQYLYNQTLRSIKFTEGSDVSAISTELALGEFKGKLLAFDATTGEPEGIDYAALTSNVTLNRESVTGDGTADYTLSFTPDSETTIQVFIEGIFIDNDRYTLSSNVITFNDTVDTGDRIDIVEIGNALEVTVPVAHITTARVQDDAITFDKMQNISTSKVLGRTTASSGSIEELSFIDDDTMATASATNIASAESVKAYVDTEVAAHGVVQQVSNIDGAVATGTTVIPADDTIPQNTEGDEYYTLAITPTSATNKLVIEVSIQLASSSGGVGCAALFQDSTASAIACGSDYFSSTGRIQQIVFRHIMTAGTTSATTFKVRAGASNAGTTTINGAGGSRLFGGVLRSGITITEIKA